MSTPTKTISANNGPPPLNDYKNSDESVDNDYSLDYPIDLSLEMNMETKCPGCYPYNHENQLAHLGPHGCLSFSLLEEGEEDRDDEDDDIETIITNIVEMENKHQQKLEEREDEEDQEEEEEEDDEEEEEEEEEVEKCGCASTLCKDAPPLFDLPEGIVLGDCCICYEEMLMTNFTITPCGHKFHSRCIFKNLAQRVECPMCRTELVHIEENDDDDDDDEGNDEDDNESWGSSEQNDDMQPISIPQMANKLVSLGYTMEDLLMMFYGSVHPQDVANPRWFPPAPVLAEAVAPVLASALAVAGAEQPPQYQQNFPNVGSHLPYTNDDDEVEVEPRAIQSRLSNDIDMIMDGILTLSHRDNRTYASVAASQDSAMPKHSEITRDQVTEEIV